MDVAMAYNNEEEADGDTWGLSMCTELLPPASVSRALFSDPDRQSSRSTLIFMLPRSYRLNEARYGPHGRKPEGARPSPVVRTTKFGKFLDQVNFGWVGGYGPHDAMTGMTDYDIKKLWLDFLNEQEYGVDGAILISDSEDSSSTASSIKEYEDKTFIDVMPRIIAARDERLAAKARKTANTVMLRRCRSVRAASARRTANTVMLRRCRSVSRRRLVLKSRSPRRLVIKERAPAILKERAPAILKPRRRRGT
jgi:hypothetical protein